MGRVVGKVDFLEESTLFTILLISKSDSTFKVECCNSIIDQGGYVTYPFFWMLEGAS